MHIKNMVDYVKSEINLSRDFYEDNVFVTLRIEPIERIIENLEQTHKDNISYAEDLVQAEAKANKYNALVEKIEETFKRRRLKVLQENKEPEHDIVLKALQELMPEEE